jgi:hypothetical protein
MTTKSKIIDNFNNVPQALDTLAQFDEDLSNALKYVMTSLKLTFFMWESPDITGLGDNAFEIPIWDRVEFSAFTLVPLVSTSHYFANRDFVSPPRKIKIGDALVSIEVTPNRAFNEIDWDKLPWPSALPLKAPLLRAYVHIVTKESEDDIWNFFDKIDDYPADVEGVFVPKNPQVSGWAGNFDLGAFLDDQNAFIDQLDQILPKKA